MSGKGKDSAQRLLAILVIVAMLAVMGIPWSVIVFFAIVTYFIWRAVQRTEHQETGRVFEFYLAANDILRDEDRHWYGFEIGDVIERGERVLRSMSDPPPLVYFSLGALYNYSGDHEAAVEHLSFAVENDLAQERHRCNPSPELRRYVHVLRKLEREPAEAPQTMAAVRNLERIRRTRAVSLLNESRERVRMVPSLAPAASPVSRIETATGHDPIAKPQAVSHPDTQRRHTPISEVLRDVYEEEKKTA